ncbi:MAG: hypothetical protein QQN55_00950 [Nitrosopumilus sp.]
MSTKIKPINQSETKFSINGILAVLQYCSKGNVSGIKYSQELSDQEDKDFKQYLIDYDII